MLEGDEMKLMNLTMESKLTQNSHTNLMYNKNEEELRKKIEGLIFKINEVSTLVREKDEELFQLNSEKLNLICDIKNLKNSEQGLAQENQLLNQKRSEIEDNMSEFKTAIFGHQTSIRQLEIQNEYLSREIANLKQEKDIFIKDLENIRN